MSGDRSPILAAEDALIKAEAEYDAAFEKYIIAIRKLERAEVEFGNENKSTGENNE